ncbi:MAG: efflux RND transporter periplasmic adaptor subunit, partial [bacterium]
LQLIEERQNSLKKAIAELENRKASFASAMMQLENALQSEQYFYEQAKLSYEQMEFEAGVKRRQQALRLRQAELSLKQANERIAAQKKIQQTNRTQAELQTQSAQLQLEQAQRMFESLTIKAPGDGLVIYKETKGSGGYAKIKISDMVWYGQDLMDISDLAVMQIKTRINELDASQLVLGQQAIITLESLPEATFYGAVSQIATLATRRRNSDMKDFDVMILINDNDPRLKPGMTAGVEIITDRLEAAVYVPLEAVFEKEDRTVVYLEGSTEPVEVKLGPQNGNSAVVASGIRAGDRVCLRDPTAALEVIGVGAPPKTAKK